MKNPEVVPEQIGILVETIATIMMTISGINAAW